MSTESNEKSKLLGEDWVQQIESSPKVQAAVSRLATLSGGEASTSVREILREMLEEGSLEYYMRRAFEIDHMSIVAPLPLRLCKFVYDVFGFGLAYRGKVTTTGETFLFSIPAGEFKRHAKFAKLHGIALREYVHERILEGVFDSPEFTSEFRLKHMLTPRFSVRGAPDNSSEDSNP